MKTSRLIKIKAHRLRSADIDISRLPGLIGDLIVLNASECSAKTSAHKGQKQACSTSHPGGNQVDCLPLVAHTHARCWAPPWLGTFVVFNNLHA